MVARKRPKQERAVATVEAILQAATYILKRKGWAAFTTNAVAEKAGVNIASLYQYFPNKEALVAELQRRHVRRARAAVPAPGREASLPEYLRAMLEAGVAEHRVDPQLHQVFDERLPRTGRRAAREGSVDPAPAWEARIKPLVQVPDLALATFISTTAAHAVIHEAAIERPELLDHPLFVDELVRLLSAYLQPGR